MLIINESGLYQAIFGSKLPKAKEFKRWVTSEVLPSIRNQKFYLKRIYPYNRNMPFFSFKSIGSMIISLLVLFSYNLTC